MDSVSCKKRVRDDADVSESTLPEVKRLREDLLDSLDDSDFCTTCPDLASFMKSFEQEISGLPETVTVVDLASDSGESQPDLGYLLGASDDELGIPPSVTSLEKPVDTELVRFTSESELNQFWRFDEQNSVYDSFDFRLNDDVSEHKNNNNTGDYVSLDGLFDYSDIGFGSSEFGWQSETLPALWYLNSVIEKLG